MRRSLLLAPVSALAFALAAAPAPSRQEREPARGRFGLALLDTHDGRRAEIDDFFPNSDCGLCHPRQQAELEGSLHSVAHEDPFYRAFAELARREAGPEVYAACSGCHSPVGVVTGLVPDVPEERLPPIAKAGVTCDVCHQIDGLSTATSPWGEPGNASFVLRPGRAKLGPSESIARNPAHTGERREFFRSSELCASCHTVIHPSNGLRLEHTYDEWKRSVYAEKGIQCQDCHMRSVEDAIRVARTLEPVEVLGRSATRGEERRIAPHYFVGGNADADVLAGGRKHAAMAAARLKSAAEIAIEGAHRDADANALRFDVVVTNVGAGHALPTSLTEVREMWLHVRVLDAGGRLVHESGALDEHGEVRPGAVRFGSGAVDAEGRPTFRPWDAVAFEWQHLVPPKGSTREPFTVPLPVGPAELTIEARLRYRIAAPHVLREVMGERAFEPEIVEMARARAEFADR